MHTEILVSGFGGQGALFAGQLLAYAALDAGLHVTWIPSYGPEMRGGTAHCTVIVSDEPIGSPLVRRPGCVIALNLPSFEKYEPLVKPGGWLVYNSSSGAGPARSRATFATSRCRQTISASSWGSAAGQRGAFGCFAGGDRDACRWKRSSTRSTRTCRSRQRKFLESNKQALRRGAAVVTSQPGRAASSG